MVKHILGVICLAAVTFAVTLAIMLLMVYTVTAEEWTLEAGATTYNTDGVSVGWYDVGAEVNIIGVKDGYWQTGDDLYIKPEEARKHLLGTFLLTWYTPSPSENGGSTLTATGHRLTDVVDYGIAVDPRVIKLGTKVYIDGYGWRRALDTGGAIKGNRIDMLSWNVPSFGKCYRKVWGLK